MAEQAKVNVTAIQTSLNTTKAKLNKALDGLEPLLTGPSADAKQLSSTGIQNALPRVVETMNTIKELLANNKLVEAKDALNKMRDDIKKIKADFKKYKPTKNNYKKAALDAKKAIGEVLGETKKVSTSLKRVRDLDKNVSNADLTSLIEKLKTTTTPTIIKSSSSLLKLVNDAIQALKLAQTYIKNGDPVSGKSKIGETIGKIEQVLSILSKTSHNPTSIEQEARENLETVASELNNIKANS